MVMDKMSTGRELVSSGDNQLRGICVPERFLLVS